MKTTSVKAAVTICTVFAWICFLAGSASASVVGSLHLTATITPSASIVISNSAGPTDTLHFRATGDESVPANEGSVTVTAMVTTSVGNSDTTIEVKCTDLTGSNPANVIPASDVVFSHGLDTGGGSWFSGSLSNGWTTLAKLTPGSGLYTGSQTFYLNVPPTANQDTYTGTISFQIVGF